MTDKPRAAGPGTTGPAPGGSAPAKPGRESSTERIVIRDKRKIDQTGKGRAGRADSAPAAETGTTPGAAETGTTPAAAETTGTAATLADPGAARPEGEPAGADTPVEPAAQTQPAARGDGEPAETDAAPTASDEETDAAPTASDGETDAAPAGGDTPAAPAGEPATAAAEAATAAAEAAAVAEDVEVEQAEAPAEEPADVEAAATEAPGLGAELAALRAELDERTRDLQRVTAEYANYRKRVDRDRGVTAEQTTATVLAALLPVLDDLDRAREHGDLVGPFGSVAEQLIGALGKFGLTAFGEKGDPFDPTRHEAVAHLTSAEVTEPTCVDVMRRGYLHNDRLLRAALVAVADPE